MTETPNFDALLADTKKVLYRLIETAPFLCNYVFVGGSALALHLRHRQSEDLDFFTWNKSLFDPSEIQHHLKEWKEKRILNLSDRQIDLLLDGVKVTFFNAEWEFLAPPKPVIFNLASLDALAAMKTNTLFLRAKYRDYYDLYFLTKTLGLERVYTSATRTVEGLTRKLFYTALTYTEDITDDNIKHLNPVVSISKKKIRQYFEKEIRESYNL